MTDIQAVEKGGTNSFHNYKYARMQDILLMLTPLMGKHGLAVFQDEVGREMFDDGRAVAIRYQFTVAHKSGEVWPERPIQSGMSMCRTSKGAFDDKTFAKAHTSARKYFLLSLFQIPTEDEDDSDNQRRRSKSDEPVPGPSGHVPPYAIEPTKNDTFDLWAKRYEAAVARSRTPDELALWDELNDEFLGKVDTGAPEVYVRIMATFEKVKAGFEPDHAAPRPQEARTEARAKPDPISTGRPEPASAAVPSPPAARQTEAVRPQGCPDPNRDPEGFLIYAAKRMKAINNAEELALVFENEIDPASDGLMKPDYSALQAELRANEKRLGG
jgi:hypothetical protein